MKLLFDFVPIALFFITYKFFGIYVATAVAIGATLAQVGFTWFKHHKIEKMQLMTLLLILLLGGATLVLHDETFIKWKPTVLYWLFALIFIGSQYIGKNPIIKRMLEHNIQLPENVWKRLNASWGIFFGVIGIANLYVVYHFNTNTWVNFKLFGILGLTLIFVFIQAFYMARYIKSTDGSSK